MTKILLDTNVLVRLYVEQSTLPAQTKGLLEDPAHALAVSYLSLMEIVLKSAIGKISYDDAIFDDLDSVGIEILHPDRALLASYKVFDPNNKDPFDNMLVAEAINRGYALLTSDSKILTLELDGLRVIDARL